MRFSQETTIKDIELIYTSMNNLKPHMTDKQYTEDLINCLETYVESEIKLYRFFLMERINERGGQQ
tara:strand:+ start:533 stop:730 length:198 start_codon:yes stop_codon:yes gene_type:complete